MLMFQAEMIRIFGFKSTYLLGDDLFHFECAGTYEALKNVCCYYDAQELIEFLDEIEWYEYDDCMSEICYSYARKYRLYTKKKRWINTSKAEKLIGL